MRVIVKNVFFTREEFGHICHFLKTVFPDSIQIDNVLYLPYVPDGGEPSYRPDIGKECDERTYQMARAIDLCNTILEFRGKKRDRTKGLELEFLQNSKERGPSYSEMVQAQYQEVNAFDVLGSGDNKPLDCPHEVQAIFDQQRKLIWFEATSCNCEEAQQWCVRQGVTYCPSIQKANEQLELLCGPDATGFGDLTKNDN